MQICIHICFGNKMVWNFQYIKLFDTWSTFLKRTETIHNKITCIQGNKAGLMLQGNAEKFLDQSKRD